MKLYYLFNGLLLVFISCSESSEQIDYDQITKEIITNSEQMELLWNQGNLHAYMDFYYKSPSLLRMTNQEFINGWEQVFGRYLYINPSLEHLDKIKIVTETLDIINNQAALHYGIRYYIDQDNKIKSNESFSILWKQIEGEWLIVKIHTCESQ
ncbi:MAG TPA: nuclear transport factor 2 family protein [Saprospiraceae bacterium]|nr:nuclear transport factor 2 family protein [Saprospiraceae bacterium]